MTSWANGYATRLSIWKLWVRIPPGLPISKVVTYIVSYNSDFGIKIEVEIGWIPISYVDS